MNVGDRTMKNNPSAGTAFTGAPGTAVSWREKGLALYHRGRFEEALDSFRHAAVRDEDDAGTVYFMAVCLEELGRDDEAGALYDRSLELEIRMQSAQSVRSDDDYMRFPGPSEGGFMDYEDTDPASPSGDRAW